MGSRTVDLPRLVHADHVGAEVAEQHAAERAGTQAAHHHDPDAPQRTGHDDHFCRRAAASSVAWLSTWLRFSSSRAAASPAASVLTCSARLVSCTPSGASSAIAGRFRVRGRAATRVDELAHQTAAVGLLGRHRAPGEHPLGGNTGPDNARQEVTHAHLGAGQAEQDRSVAKVAAAEQILMSAARHNASPAPTHGPLTAATTGCGKSQIACGSAAIASWNRSRSIAGAVASGAAGPKSRMSMPEQKPRPAPVTTTALTDVSVAKRRMSASVRPAWRR